MGVLLGDPQYFRMNIFTPCLLEKNSGCLEWSAKTKSMDHGLASDSINARIIEDLSLQIYYTRERRNEGSAHVHSLEIKRYYTLVTLPANVQNPTFCEGMLDTKKSRDKQTGKPMENTKIII